MQIKVGCCGFPGGIKKYFQEFRVVEVQSTFYKLPQLKTAQKWRKMAPKDFIFCLKCFQGITHPVSSPTWRRSGIKDLERIKDKVGFLMPTKEVFCFWNQTLEICKILNSPVCLIQLPASFKENEENLKNAEKFFSEIEKDEISIALELRGWSKEEFKNLCKKFDLISCVDPLKEDPLYFSKKKIAYFRLHGSYEKGGINYNYKYNKKELVELKKRIKNLKSVEKAFLFFNNIFMLENAKEFSKMINLV
ncbi:MAG: DUF72 domain-containing protein [Candidatus Aenigmatarchaeota archaeon]